MYKEEKMKKKLMLIILFFTVSVTLFSEAIPKIGIINYSKLISSFSKSSYAMQEIDRLTKSYEDGVASIQKDISALEERKLYYSTLDDNFNVLKMDEQVEIKKKYLQEYSRLRLKNIKDKQNNIFESPAFLREVLRKIEYIAESEGYSAIFNSKDPYLIWWSQSVDITDLVIEQLNPKN